MASGSLFKDFPVGFIVERQLYNASSVPQVDENQVSEIPDFLNKSADNDGFSGFSDFAAVASTA